jgi:hypothetical protein
MRAVVVREFGGPEALELIEAPIPEPGPKQVRVAVRAAGVNPVDVAVRSGGLLGIGFTVPAEQYGVGWDVAGVVDAVGEGSVFAVGDRVVGLVDRLDLPLGAYAEFVVLDDASVGYAPRTTSDVENASLPLTLLTADQSLELAGLAAGNSLLVTGAAGGVGGFAVQLAALRGVEVSRSPPPPTSSSCAISARSTSSTARPGWPMPSAGTCPAAWTAWSTRRSCAPSPWRLCAPRGCSCPSRSAPTRPRAAGRRCGSNGSGPTAPA